MNDVFDRLSGMDRAILDLSICLMIGLILSCVCRRNPSRACSALLLGSVAGGVAFFLSLGIGQLNLGVLSQSAILAAEANRRGDPQIEHRKASGDQPGQTAPRLSGSRGKRAEGPAEPALGDLGMGMESVMGSRWSKSWRAWFAAAWTAVSLFLLARLAVFFWAARRIMSIFRHELAHLCRRDHWACLFCEIFVSLIPWHPLAWWVKRRMFELMERACDDWALDGSVSADNYARLLLRILPERKPLLVLGVASNRMQIEKRIRHILERGSSVPWAGRSWAAVASAAFLLVAGGLGIAQTKKGANEGSGGKEVQGQNRREDRLILRRVEEGGRLTGKWFAWIDDKSNSVVLRHEKTGEVRTISARTLGEGAKGTVSDVIASRDGTHFIFQWTEEGKETELRQMALKGTASWRIHASGDFRYSIYDWSPDGKHLYAAGIRKGSNPRQYALVQIAVTDGSTQIIQELGLNYPYTLLATPDGRFLIYDLLQTKADSLSEITLQFPLPRDIYALDLSSGKRSTIVEHAANDELLAVSSDGEWVVFESDRFGVVDFWLIGMGNGKARGLPRRIYNYPGEAVEPYGMSEGGRFYYFARKLGERQILAAAFDLNQGIQPESIRIMGQTLKEERLTSPRWSARENVLAYVSMKTYGKQARGLHLQTYSDGFTKSIPELMQGFQNPVWTTGNEKILFTGGQVNGGRQGIYAVEISQAKLSEIMGNDSERFYTSLELSPENDAIYYIEHSRREEKTALKRRDLASGKTEEIYSNPRMSVMRFALSPNGRWLLIGIDSETAVKEQYSRRFNEDGVGALTLNVIPTSGGEVRELVKHTEQDRLVWFDWMPDNETVVYSSWNSTQTAFWRTSLTNGGSRKLSELALKIRAFDINATGDRIAFESGDIYQRGNWVMENFHPMSNK